MSLCSECHHQPSGRIADYGANCHCRCHDVADAGPELLHALKEAFDMIVWMSGSEDFAPNGKAGVGWEKQRKKIDLIVNTVAVAEGRRAALTTQGE